MLARVELTVSVLVERQLFFGYLPIPRISGFKDAFSGKVIANAFTVGLIDPLEVEKTWKKINSEDDLPLPPLLRMTGLAVYE